MVTKFLNIDTDNTLSANSNERVPSQKAVKTYTDNLTTAKQNKVLDTPITVGSVEETTVEGALWAINTSLSNKQNQSLSSAITVDGTQQTTVEGTLNALNIYANSKQNNLTAGDNITINNNVISAKDTTYIAGTGISIDEDSDENLVISNTQTSAEWGNITGTLSNQTDLQNALNSKQDIITDLNTIRSGAEAGSTAVQPGDLATVATSGNYIDLINKPTIPTKTSDLTNDSGFITGITSSDVTTALGYTPYDSTNPDGYTTNIGTVTSVNNTQPDSNGNVNINIPTPATVDQTYDSTSTNAQSGTAVAEAISTKQDTLVSGTNIKTVNGNSLLGSGNIDIDSLPSQSGQSGKFLTTDGTDASWSDKPLVNTATYTSSGMVIGGSDTGYPSVVAVGISSKATLGGTAVGNLADAGIYGIALGYNAKTTGSYAIQLNCSSGNQTNADDNTFKVGNQNGNFELMSADGTIPVARLKTMTGADGTNAGTKGAVPAPAATDNTKFLRGDGTWAAVNSAVWGGVTGTLSNQTDLQTALDAKSGVVFREW